MAPTATVESLLEQVHQQFEAADLSFGHGTNNAWDEAVALVLGVTGADDDVAALSQNVDPETEGVVRTLASRRVQERIPLAYLLGRCWFSGFEFLVEPGIVIPRSPIAGLLREGLRPWISNDPARVLDLCSGSGCLGILAAHAFPHAEVVLAELDPNAAALALRNIAAHDLTDRVVVAEGDLFSAVSGRFDLILANPPYVDAADMAALPPEYRHEPVAGLASGEDGCDLVARILAQAPRHLAAGGLLVCEVGASAPALLRRFPDLPFTWPHLPDGGAGVFLLEASALGSHTAPLEPPTG